MGKQNGHIDEYDHHDEFHRRQTPMSERKKPMKIKYISSPMMVKASSASEFRAIVQQHTGQNPAGQKELRLTNAGRLRRRPIHKSYLSSRSEEDKGFSDIIETPNVKQLVVGHDYNVVEDTLSLNSMSVTDRFDGMDSWL